MQSFKLSAVALALSAVAFSASALTSIDDASLSQVTGQDGVTIAGDLHINIGSFTWIDNEASSAGGSVSFNNIQIAGLFIQTIDVLSQATFRGAVAGALASYDSATAGANATALVTYLTTTGGNTSDVVQFAFPNVGVSHSVTPTITVGSITNGNSAASYGSLVIKNLDLQGTKIWLWAH